jgi:hypothetical protein
MLRHVATAFNICVFIARLLSANRTLLKVPKCEIFDSSDFPYFYTIKSSCVGDLVVKIKKNILNISGFI